MTTCIFRIRRAMMTSGEATPARQPDGERFQKIPMGGGGRLAGARCRALRRPARGPKRVAAAISQPRQPAPRHLHRQLPRRPRPARGQTREHRSDRRRSNRVCRRARTRGRRLHQIHLSRSCQAGAHRHSRRPGGGLRAQVSTGALSRDAAPVRLRRSAISSRRAARRERDRRRGRHRYSRTRRRHPAAASPDQTGVHGDGIRTAGTVLASSSSRASSRAFTIG